MTGQLAPARPLRRDAARNRELILAAAARLFAEQGLDASVEDIARVAGVGMGTLYRRFPAKEDLVDALVRDVLTSVHRLAVQAAEAPHGTGLELFLRDAVALQAERRGCLQRLWAAVSEAELNAQVRTTIDGLLADAQQHGRVRTDLTGADVTVAFCALGGVIASSAGHPAVWRRHLELVLAGLRPAAQPLATPPLDPADLDEVLRAACR